MEYISTNFNNFKYRVGVFGGSFDPPTLGHESVIQQLLSPQSLFLSINEIVLVPSAAHAFGKKLTALSSRLDMLALFIDDITAKYPDFKSKIRVLNIEPELVHLHSTGYVYTYDVLEKVENIYKNNRKNTEISFIIGPDLANPEIFNKFYRANDIINKWPIVIVEQKLAIRSTYVRNYIAENALIIPTQDLIKQLDTMISSRVMANIITHKRYFPDAHQAQINIKLNLVIFSIQHNDLYILVNKITLNQLPYALINTREDKQLEDVLNRSLINQLGHLPDYYEQVITQGGKQNKTDQWHLNITYFCLTSVTHLNNQISSWIKVSDFIKEVASEDQKNSLILCMERLKNKASYTSIPCYLTNQMFTLSELQKIYEIVLGHKLEKKSFRRRFLDSGLLEDTGQIRKANHRPAQLYKLASSPHIPYYFSRTIEGSRN